MQIKTIKTTTTPVTFTCVDCGSKYSIKLAAVKNSKDFPKFCRNCKR